MTEVAPRVILRLGSHAEKEYVEKTQALMDGLILGANLVEATPGATASLALRFSAAAKGKKVPVYIDPMTYAFGTYVDPASGESRFDLDWIKSDQKVGGRKKGKTVRQFKRSYSALSRELGPVFQEVLSRGRAFRPNDFTESLVGQMVNGVLEYQRTRLRRELATDPEFGDLAAKLPLPPVLFAPYFYVDPTDEERWLAVNLALARAGAAVSASDMPVHAVLCADRSILTSAFVSRIAGDLSEAQVTGVWLWFSKLEEEKASTEILQSLRSLVEGLTAAGLEVYQLHGGFFSLALSRVGLRGISHGIGYGEQKDVVPIIGQSTPTVRYYLTPLRRRLGVPEIQRSFPAVGITNVAGFFEEICGCVVCRGVLQEDLTRFAQFGALHYSTPQSKRQAQTPAAAKRCRFHFLLRRFMERDWVAKVSRSDVVAALDLARGRWNSAPPLRDELTHLERWAAALR